MPFGGSITLGAILPIIFISFKFGPLLGAQTAALCAMVKILISFYPPPSKTLLGYILLVMFDYILPYIAAGLSSLYSFWIKNREKAIVFATFFSYFFKFVFSVISGMVIWRDYSLYENWFLYSVIYNLSYFVPNLIISLLILKFCFKYKSLVNHDFFKHF